MAEAGRIANTNSRAMLQRVTVITKIILAHVLAVEKRSLKYKNTTLGRFCYRRKSQIVASPSSALAGGSRQLPPFIAPGDHRTALDNLSLSSHASYSLWVSSSSSRNYIRRGVVAPGKPAWNNAWSCWSGI